jgi:hypothetical protein
MNTRAFLAIGLPAFLVLLGGCIIVDGTTSGSTGSGAGGAGLTSSSSSSSSGTAGAGVGGAAGQGGEAGAGNGGAGGGPSCVDDADGMKDLIACETLNTQATGSVCGAGNNEDPLANGLCKYGFEIFQGGAFDVLHACLQKIEGDAVNACDELQVKDCMGKMYVAACPSQDAADACVSIAKNLCINGEIFDTQTCSQQTNPLNSAGLQKVADCITNSALTDCNDAYKACFDQVFSF